MRLTYLAGLIIISLLNSIVFAQEIEVISQTKDKVILQINLPTYHFEERYQDNSRYQVIQVEGWGKIDIQGYPQLPTRGILIGIPLEGEVQAEVINGDTEEISNLDIYPVPKRILEEREGITILKEIFYKNEKIYAQDEYFPKELVQISGIGFLRNQRFAKIDIYPFQYNPQKRRLKVCRQALIKVKFVGGELKPLTFYPEEVPYEEMLKEVLVNYKTLGRFERKISEERVKAQKESQNDNFPKLKIHLNTKGIYEIGYKDLISFWPSLNSIDPRKIQLWHLGEKIPIKFKQDGDLDGRFNLTDSFLFYAPSLSDYYYYFYTNDDVYWLTLESESGTRMNSVDGSVRGGEVLTTFVNQYHGEENHEYWQALPNGEGQDHYFWKKLQITQANVPVSADINFTLKNISTTSYTCTLTYDFRGKTDTSANPDHHTQILINGNQVSDEKWNGEIDFQKTVTFPQSYLREGSNTLTIKSLGDTEAGNIDIVYFNYFDLTYLDTYVAEDNTLEFNVNASGLCEIAIAGFSSSNINLFEITDPWNPKNLINTTITTGNILKFSDIISGEKEYIAVAGRAKSPVLIETDISSNLKSPDNGADYLIITHENFYDTIQTLATYRASQGVRVMVVKVGDVYDEFSYGMFDPQAIKDFLTYAYENYQKPAPLYCLLIGDANMDYKDNLNTGRKNYIPTYLIQTAELGDTPTDNWFACVSGSDLLPDMYLGRISCQNPTELTNIVNKILDYEEAGNEAWNKQVLFVADNEDNENSFEYVNNYLIESCLPGGYQAFKVYLSQYSAVNEARSDLINDIDQGQLMTVYVGHGSVDNWAGEYLFTSEDVSKLNNSLKLTFVVPLTCLNGCFSSPVDDYSLAETFLNGYDSSTKTYLPVGAIGCFAPTGLGHTGEHQVLAESLFDYIFKYRYILQGVATTAAKIDAYTHGVSSDIIQTFILLGDPYTTLKVFSDFCSEWSDVIKKYEKYVDSQDSQASWNEVIDCYNSYVNQNS